jgi:hypothetical protein
MRRNLSDMKEELQVYEDDGSKQKDVSAKVEAEREAERQLTEERVAELEKSVTVIGSKESL